VVDPSQAALDDHVEVQGLHQSVGTVVAGCGSAVEQSGCCERESAVADGHGDDCLAVSGPQPVEQCVGKVDADRGHDHDVGGGAIGEFALWHDAHTSGEGQRLGRGRDQ